MGNGAEHRTIRSKQSVGQTHASSAVGHRAERILALAAVVVSLAAAPAPSPEQLHLKPGASGKVCVGCHADFEEILKRPFVHTPVKAGNCADCHNPHASSHGKLLEESPNRICAKCHGDILPAKAHSSHPAAVSGDCVKCHDPHGSANKANLILPGNQLCASCHQAVTDAVGKVAFRHTPVDKGCLGCHVPHASEGQASLLKSGEPGLCAGCHPTNAAPFVKQHQGYPVGKARCTSCHDPHGSNARGILWANVHPPLANRMCGQCHNDPGSSAPLATKKEGIDLCRGCHGNLLNEAIGKKKLHWPVMAKGACLTCHNPHASKESGLLVAGPKQVCGSCHADTMARAARGISKHEPFQQGNCKACHAPHASDNPFFLTAASVIDVCGDCHDWQKHSTHPLGEKTADLRNKNLPVDCTSCHRAHGTEFGKLAPFDPKRDLCVQCHRDMTR